MNRKQTDLAAGVLLTAIVLLGVLSAIQLSVTDSPMRSEMESVPIMAMVGPVLMSLLVASIVGGVYMYARSRLFGPQANTTTGADVPNDSEDTTGANDGGEPVPAATDETQPPGVEGQRQILDVLPDDERRILEPVIESPGLTQIEVRDRSGFSKSKVSQAITDLEKRGLLYREPQGRTYRVYPEADLDERH